MRFFASSFAKASEDKQHGMKRLCLNASPWQAELCSFIVLVFVLQSTNALSVVDIAGIG